MKYYIGMACIMALSACTGAAKKQSVAVDSTAVAATPNTGGNVVLTDPRVQGIYDHYLLLKNALVASNYDAAKLPRQVWLRSCQRMRDAKIPH